MSTNEPGANRHVSEEANSQSECRIFGDTIMKKKNKNIIRIIFQNINGWGTKVNSNKPELIRRLMEEKEADIMSMAEVNVNWDRVGIQISMNRTCKKWFKVSKTSTAYNQHDKKGNKHQPGGTAIISVGDIALRVTNYEQDERRIGRWCSQRIQGKDGIATRIVSVYVPIVARLHGHKKVYCQ